MRRLVILGAPRTKKTSNRIFRPAGTKRLRIVPSATHQAWFAAALPQVRVQNAGNAPITQPVSVAAVFYRDALRGDAVGYYQALADLLERSGVVEDDKWIVDWDGSRLRKDADRPRIEVYVQAVRR
jgi:Holliday junction resolvase RusA-like endonuclease